MKKGFKKHVITTDVNNKAEYLNSVICNTSYAVGYEPLSVIYCGYWDGMQYDHVQFYCTDEYLDKMKEFIDRFKDFSEVEIVK